jgi:hypothetical protein
MYDLEIRFPPMRMEEEEEIKGVEKPGMGYTTQIEEPQKENLEKKETIIRPDTKLLNQLMRERQKIVDSKLWTRHKLKLLRANSDALVAAQGGSIKSSKRENIVYSILIFGGAVTVILAFLTIALDLPAEIALTFVGTTLGGTIATIAQKLGKL